MPGFTEKYKQNDENGGIFIGTVIGTNPGTFNVQVAPAGQHDIILRQAVPLSAIFSHLIGFKESVLPPVGALVLCYRSGEGLCYILGVVPAEDKSGLSGMFPTRAVLGAGDGNNDSYTSAGYGLDSTKQYTFNRNRPSDLTEGEYALSNDFGILLGLFQQFAVLKASDLAQVQVHILDDLVRVISHNFQHYTCLGEHKVFHDGKGLHMEFGITHDPQEAMGIPLGGGGSVFQDTGKNNKDDSENFIKLHSEKLLGIERLKGFVGAMSDFVQLMLVRPANAETRSSDGTTPITPDRGLFNTHLSSDGTFCMRSLGGIFLEKTNWIRAIQRIRTPEDPEGDDASADTFDYKDKKSFDFDTTHPYTYFLQIRDYLAYLQEDLAYRNFKTHEKDFSVNDDPTKESPLEAITAVHKKLETKYEPRVSGMYMMPNGGIMLKDAWGSAIVMEGGNIYLQPAKDLVSQPLRNSVSKVGGFTSMASRLDFDISSSNGAFRLKTEGTQHLYSANSGIVIQADGAVFGGEYSPLLPEDGGLTHVSGIILSAPSNGIYQYSKENFTKTTGAIVENANHIVQEAAKLIFLTCDHEVVINSNTHTILASDGNVSITAESSLVALGQNATVIGRADQIFGTTNLFSGTVEGLLDADQVQSYLLKLDDFDTVHSLDMLSNFRDEESQKFKDLKFRFQKSEVYGLLDSEIFPQTIAQQEDTAFSNIVLQKWEEKPVNETYPYPGAGLADTYVTANLGNAESIDGNIFNKVIASSNATLDELKNLFTEYKVKI